jgi:hypothetical protein
MLLCIHSCPFTPTKSRQNCGFNNLATYLPAFPPQLSATAPHSSAGTSADMGEVEILSLASRKQTYACGPPNPKARGKQCEVTNVADNSLPTSRDAYSSASTVYTFYGKSIGADYTLQPFNLTTTLIFVYGGEANPPDPSQQGDNQASGSQYGKAPCTHRVHRQQVGPVQPQAIA